MGVGWPSTAAGRCALSGQPQVTQAEPSHHGSVPTSPWEEVGGARQPPPLGTGRVGTEGSFLSDQGHPAQQWLGRDRGQTEVAKGTRPGVCKEGHEESLGDRRGQGGPRPLHGTGVLSEGRPGKSWVWVGLGSAQDSNSLSKLMTQPWTFQQQPLDTLWEVTGPSSLTTSGAGSAHRG